MRRTGPDLLVQVRLTPRGGRDAVDGLMILSDGRPVLAARVRAVPEDGRANAALLALLAEVAGCSRSAVSLEAGATARLKTLRISDPDGQAEARLGALIAAG